MHRLATTPEQCEALGASLAESRIRGAPMLLTVYLTGDLGAGKTTLARGFVRACGIGSAARSPSYTLLELYEAVDLTILHLDLYRLIDPAEIEELGLREWARPGVVWLIEWPERGVGYLPPADLVLTLRASAAGHDIDAVAATPVGEIWLERQAALELRPSHS